MIPHEVAEAEDHLAKFLVERDEHAEHGQRAGEHLVVRSPGRNLRDPRYVMAGVPYRADRVSGCILVREEDRHVK